MWDGSTARNVAHDNDDRTTHHDPPKVHKRPRVGPPTATTTTEPPTPHRQDHPLKRPRFILEQEGAHLVPTSLALLPPTSLPPPPLPLPSLLGPQYNSQEEGAPRRSYVCARTTRQQLDLEDHVRMEDAVPESASTFPAESQQTEWSVAFTAPASRRSSSSTTSLPWTASPKLSKSPSVPSESESESRRTPQHPQPQSSSSRWLFLSHGIGGSSQSISSTLTNFGETTTATGSDDNDNEEGDQDWDGSSAPLDALDALTDQVQSWSLTRVRNRTGGGGRSGTTGVGTAAPPPLRPRVSTNTAPERRNAQRSMLRALRLPTVTAVDPTGSGRASSAQDSSGTTEAKVRSDGSSSASSSSSLCRTASGNHSSSHHSSSSTAGHSSDVMGD